MIDQFIASDFSFMTYGLL